MSATDTDQPGSKRTSPSRRMAVFVPSMHGGGAERTMLNLSQGAVERGLAVDLILSRAEGPYMAKIPNGVRVVDLKAPRVLASLPGLVRYLRTESPLAMVSAMNHANIVALWARRLAGSHARLVVSEQNTLSQSAGHGLTWRSRFMPHLIRRFYPWADRISAVSAGAADDLSRMAGIPRERVQVIYNPVLTPGLAERARAPLDHPWFQSCQPPVLLAMGRLREQKDFPTLIRAFSKVRETTPCRLLILGEGPERPALHDLVKELHLRGEVSLPGFVDNPYAYLSRAQLFVLSSKWEGLPTVLIEAMYCGAPVVSTDCPSGPREILAGGKYGQLVPVGDGAAMAQAIESTLVSRPPVPPRESWVPFESGVVTDQYIQALFGDC